ncbi:MAG: MFS transporter, partial [Betaproteobacteria bacterium]|nr:MFS transporter [Betaproteobacteria bacterium]
RWGLAVFVCASLACGAAPSLGWLVAARVIQALGAALLTPASMSIVLAAFPIEKRAVAVSLWGAVGGLAAAVGPSLGSWVTHHAGWPWAFYINLPVGLWALWRSTSHIKEAVKPVQPRRVDIVGLLLMLLAVGTVVLAIVESREERWSSENLFALIGVGVLSGLVFVWWARSRSDALIDLSLFKHRTYRFVNAATLVFGAAFSMMFLGFFFFLIGVWHYSLPMAGLAVTPGPLLVMPTALLTGKLASRVGHRRFLLGGSLLYAASSLWFLGVPGSEPNYVLNWLPGLVMSGIAVGLVLPSLSAAAVSRLPAAHYAVGSAVNQATRQIGAAFGVALTVAMLAQPTLQRADFTSMYRLHAGLALLTGLLCLPVDTKPQSS